MSQKETYRVSATLPTTSVPLLSCGVITEQHIANGMEPVTVNAIIDTGSNRTSLSPRLIAMLGLAYSGTTTADSTTDKDVPVDVYSGAVFVFGNIMVGPRYVHAVDLPDGEDVLIGMDVISLGRLTIEPADNGRYRFEFTLEAER